MREIIFDTETTGLHKESDRIVEIGCVEMVDRYLTGKTFHVYLNPQGVLIPDEVVAVHGLTNERLKDEPIFDEIADDFLDFIEGATLIAHNASFDLGFLNAELERVKKPLISVDRILDTLAMARRKYPMGPNSLDALCKRFGIDNSHRTLHGALLDSEILADVYIELIGGKQGALGFEGINKRLNHNENTAHHLKHVKVRPSPLASRLTQHDLDQHAALLKKIGDNALWHRFQSS
ncbi:DNA polymerase III subunit epsilon [Bartonella tamiae]|uniref:DNA polymerase III subunit epsilon n=1 Tax=Bartonella tamiae Th239 TaxID=1094558 RepID=J0QY23_9HYPH|nr:DNA polymerase III subunit epsilon [Bartonella tamiae]EJF90986.1 DNA polymerase III, epsilon subunit [Bartonella tamiae Th239]EJF93349.1 DNA polymerase III, epsilon subunit [Bartonella tamiae Th307]